MRVGLDHRPDVLDGAGDDLGQVNRLLAQRHRAAGDAGDVEQVLDQPRHVAGLADDHAADLADHRLVEGAGPEQMGGGLDRGQGVAQLVGQRGEELLLAPLGLADRQVAPGVIDGVGGLADVLLDHLELPVRRPVRLAEEGGDRAQQIAIAGGQRDAETGPEPPHS